MEDELFIALQPVVDSVGLGLVDVERRASVLLVTVDQAGGVDLDALTAANRALSRALDELDPIPGRYSLEVSSPGLERRLRTPAHFSRAVGEVVAVKTRPQVPGDRRLRGRLVVAGDEGFELVLEDPDRQPAGGNDDEDVRDIRVRLSYSDVDRVRTVFDWGPAAGGEHKAPKRGAGGGRTATSGGPGADSRGRRGKQVVNR